MEIRLVRNDEMNQAIQLADDIFRDSEQSSMGTSFPFLFVPGQSHSYGAFANGKLVSFMGLVPFVLHVDKARLNVFSMGAVCTHPDYRGQGIASKLLDRCKQHVDEAGASLLFISGDRSLYTRVHCYPFGRTERFTLNAASAARLKAIASTVQADNSRPVLRPFEAVDTFTLHAAAAAREVAYAQSVTDLLRLIDAEAYASCAKLEHQTIVAASGNGSVEAFTVIATSGRFTGSNSPTAVEWAGPANHIAALLADAVERWNLPQLEVPVCWHDQQLIQLLQEAAVPSVSKANSGTVFVVNAQRVLEQAALYSNDGQKPAISTQQDGSYLLVVGETSIGLTPAELVSLLFDPASPHKQSLSKWSPIPLPYMNGLNYT